MPDIIDTFIIELGLDISKFNKGQRDALDAMRKMHNEAKSRGKDIEGAMNKFQESLLKLKHGALTLFSAFVGGRGIKEFVEYLTQSDSAMNRFSRVINVSVNDLSRWQRGATSLGGSAEGVRQSFQRFSDVFEAKKVGKIDAAFFNLLSRIAVEGGHAIDVSKGLPEVFEALGENLKEIEKHSGTTRANFLARQLGITPDMVPLLLANTRQVLKEADALRNVTKEDADAAERRLKAWEHLQSVAESIGRAVTTWISPAMEKAMEGATELGQDVLGTGKPLNKEATSGWSGFLRGLMLTFQGEEGAEAWATTQGERWRARQGHRRPRFGGGAPVAGLQQFSKSDAGETTPLTAALASSLMGSVPGLQQFTSFKDAYHTHGAHAAGRGLDFTLKDPKQAAQVAAAIRTELTARGINATVLDEYNTKSPGWTGGHIHIGLPQGTTPEQVQGLGGAGAGKGAGGKTSMVHSEVNIAQLTVTTQATNADQIARDIQPALNRYRYVQQANVG